MTLAELADSCGELRCKIRKRKGNEEEEEKLMITCLVFSHLRHGDFIQKTLSFLTSTLTDCRAKLHQYITKRRKKISRELGVF